MSGHSQAGPLPHVRRYHDSARSSREVVHLGTIVVEQLHLCGGAQAHARADPSTRKRLHVPVIASGQADLPVENSGAGWPMTVPRVLQTLGVGMSPAGCLETEPGRGC